MLKLYTDVNKMKSEVGEMLNTYFTDPVSRTVSPFHREIGNSAKRAGLSRLFPNHQTPNLHETD
jgi:hypothetical protein